MLSLRLDKEEEHVKPIDSTLVESLRARLEELRFELLEDPRFQEYERVKSLLDVWSTLADQPPAPKPRGSPLAERPPAPRPQGSTMADQPPVPWLPGKVGRVVTDTGMAAVCEAAAEFLRKKGSRAPSGEIQAALVDGGLMRPGRRDRTRVTSYLGRKKEVFDNIRGEGYGLVEWSAASANRP